MDNKEMMENLQKSLKWNQAINLILVALIICLLGGGYFVFQKVTPVIELVPEIKASLETLKQIDYEALNEAIGALDVEAINKALDSLDVDGLNAKIEEMDMESLNKALEGLDTEEMTEAMENLNNAVDKLEKIGESLSALGEWFRTKFNF